MHSGSFLDLPLRKACKARRSNLIFGEITRPTLRSHLLPLLSLSTLFTCCYFAIICISFHTSLPFISTMAITTDSMLTTSSVVSDTSATETWEDILMDTKAEEEDLLSETSYQEAIQVLQVWQQEEHDNDAVMVSQEEDDVIMQLDADEGLLPSLNDFYNSISGDIMPPEELFADAVISFSSSEADFVISKCSSKKESSDSFLVVPEDEEDKYIDAASEKEKIFEETLLKLTESMKRSQETRKSLYAKTPKLVDYKRLKSVHKVLSSIAFSSYQIDTYCTSLTRAGTTISS